MSDTILSFVEDARGKQFALLCLAPLLVTILCHTSGFLPHQYLHSVSGVHQQTKRRMMDSEMLQSTKEPTAVDDVATTLKETPVTINVVANDRGGDSDDDDGEDKNDIDAATVDLDPSTLPIDNVLQTSAGLYSVNDAGDVTYVPAQAFTGQSTIVYTVNNRRGETSNRASLLITVTAKDEPPVISGQVPDPLTTSVNQAIVIGFEHLQVSDPDSSYPNGFSLIVSPGDNYTLSGTTVIPNPGFVGMLSVPVAVNDGAETSNTFNVSVYVDGNDVPVITGQEALVINEDNTLAIALTHLHVTDDNAYPAEFTLAIGAGANYSVSGTTIIPAMDYHGELHIPVTVNDGANTSAPFDLVVTVNSVNDVPQIIGQNSASTVENQPIQLTLGHLVVTDRDHTYPNGFTMYVNPGANYISSGTTVTPTAGFTGTLSVDVYVSDDSDVSAVFSFQLAVTPVNDPPVITGQAFLSTNEEQAVDISLSHVSVSDPDSPFPTGFTLIVLPGAGYTPSGATVIPDPNFYGELNVPIQVNDGLANSAPFNFKLQVNPINDAPAFDAIPVQRVSENGTPSAVIIRNISKGPRENDQQVTFIATSGNTAIIPNPVVTYDGSGPTATLVYSLVPNTSGVVTITLVAVDNGAAGAPHQNAYSSSFQIEVLEINNAPTLDPIADVSVQEDAPQQSVALTGINAGAGESQTLTAEVTTNKPELFEVLQVVYTSPQASGTLLVKPNANAFGSASIRVKVSDDGSSLSPSVNFVSRAFVFTILPVNDPPVFASTPITVAAVNEAYEYIAEVTDLETPALPFSVAAKPSWVTLSGLGNGKARLSGTPRASDTGSTQMHIVVTDGDLVVEQQFTIIVNTRPEVKTFTIAAEEDRSFTFHNEFEQAYSDADNHPLASVLITAEPSSGTLLLSSRELATGDTIAASDIPSLVYKPDINFAGADIFYWKGGDGYHFSAQPAAVGVEVTPVNDPPMVLPRIDTVLFEVNGEAAPFTDNFFIDDPDDDSLAFAEIGFHIQNFYAHLDVLSFQNTANIRGIYDFETGKLSLNGKASVADYNQAIRSVLYNHLNTLDPELKMKSLYVVLNDGEVSGDPGDRLIRLAYTFVELEIPSAFTPNGDNANDTWLITRPGGIEKLTAAVISVFTRRGDLVFRTEGFEMPWDGTHNGKLLPSDTYFYTIDLNLRSKKTYRGTVTILR